ncbi:hypothetical protein ODJ79_06245 [Actinoplanes sp. KI2]|uniref:hypothetical protein n=1 Tax=Actinoplanes sp. KI2 TaxID=2983315 RepID=UPI0021D59A0E|nr:hypothetical protein [Actinoplanes sp. KI2]MCU7723304.1 hypothetical protein [Actinoplanes sp. KI2]
MKKLLARTAAAVVLLSGLVGLTPSSPAMASTCSTKGCGGEVTNHSSRLVYVVNCWLSSNPGTWRGNIPSCATQWSAYASNAYFALGHPDTTNNYPKYYDTDAFRVDAGCVLTESDNGGANQVYNNKGNSTPLWVKISNPSGVLIYSVVC